MVYLSSYIDGHKDVDTLNGFSNDTLDYFEEIYEKYSTLTGFDGFSEESSNGYFWADLDISITSIDNDNFDAALDVNYYRDQTSPTINYITYSSSDIDGAEVGDAVSIEVEFSEDVYVTGTPQLELETYDTNRFVDYESGSGTDTLTFTYTVQSGDNANNLYFDWDSVLSSNGGTIEDSAGNVTDDFYDGGQDLSGSDLYSLTFDLKEDNKFHLTEKAVYDTVDYVNYYDGNSVFFNFHSDEVIKSLNLETGIYKTESVLDSNFNFYLGDTYFNGINNYSQTNSYGLVASINNGENLTVVQNIEKENHSVLFEIEIENDAWHYVDDITENKNGTLNLVAGKSIWRSLDALTFQEVEETYELYTYNSEGISNKIDLGTYNNYYKYDIIDDQWELVELSLNSFFLWNDDDSDTWLVSEYEFRDEISKDAFNYYEAYVLDDDFDINNDPNLTLELERNLDFDNYFTLGSRSDNQGIAFGFIYSETEATHEYKLDIHDRITKKIEEANEWDKINYSNYDWSEVDYESLTGNDIENIKWNKVDLVSVLESENFKFDSVDWQEISEDGGINEEQAYNLINDFDFDEDNDLINLKYLSSVEKIKAGGGNDVVTGNSQNNIFYGQRGNDTLNGKKGSDKLYGGDGKDRLFGGAEDDLLSGGEGNDNLNGGSGRDTAIFGSANNRINLANKNRQNTLEGKDILTGIENVKGGDGNDFIYGDALANDLYGENNDDRLYGRDGNDRLYGEAGNDILYAGNGRDILNGATGDDILYGGNGVDSLYAEIGDDILYGGNDIDKLYAGTGNDILYGGNGKDILYGGTGNDRLYGEAGNDRLYAGNGRDILNGATGDDILYGGNGVDSLYAEIGDDILYGGNDIDKLYAGTGNDILYGGNGKDILYGGTGDDILYGGNDIDKLYGGTGDDILYGGNGNDKIYGGVGNDIFQINSGNGRSVISDYTAGEDRIELLDGITENDLTFGFVGGHTRISDGDGDLLAIVQNTIADDLTFI